MKIFSIAAGKGGVGRSCVAAFTGVALAQMGKKILLAELGGGGRSLDLMISLPGTTLFHMGDVLSGACNPREALIPSSIYKDLFLLPAPPSDTGSAVTEKELRSILRGLPDKFDYLILDGADFRLIPPCLPDCILMVCTPDTLSIRSAATLTQNLNRAGAKEIRLVINRVPAEIPPIKGAEDFDDVIDLIGARLIAVIPESPKLAYAANNSEPLDRESLTPQIFGRLAERLMGKNSPLLVR